MSVHSVSLPPNAGTSRGPASAKKKKNKNGGADEPHVYSSADFHHIHDVHVDSTLIPHEGMLSGELSGAGYAAYEETQLRKVGGWSSHIHKKPDFNLDTAQLKRLMQIMDRVRSRKKFDSKLLNLSKAADRQKMRMKMLEELIVVEDQNFRNERVLACGCSDPMRFCIVGDEVRLRQELEVMRADKHVINQREIARGGRTLLHEAVGNGHLPIVRVLLSDFRANPNVATLLGWASPLHLAAEKNHRQIAAYLIAFGANLRAVDSFGRTPLHMVCSEHMLRLFIKYADRLDPNTKSTEGLLPSQHYAKYAGEERNPTLELLMQRFEDRVRSEAAKELRLLQQEEWDRQQSDANDFPLAISQNSSIVDSRDPNNPHKRSKNLYKYQKGK